ncbi:MAG TPA: DUF6763 family protein [Steroidobacteraceae bacterium]
MNSTVGSPQIGQWYERMDTAEVFQVTGIDDGAGTIEIQSFDGDVDEMDFQVWSALPLELAQPSEDWLAPVEDMDAQDVASTRAETILDNPLVLERWAEAGSGHVVL